MLLIPKLGIQMLYQIEGEIRKDYAQIPYPYRCIM